MPNHPVGPQPGPSIAALTAAYRAGTLSPAQVLSRVSDVVEARGDDGIWISTVGRVQLRARAAELADDPAAATLPLFGVPFAVKDNIDVVGLPTTCGCPDFGYLPARSAPAVDRLLDAGAVLVGKTNLDQFATGLTGARSPYGIPGNVYGRDLIPGGSSSGSALAVATGQVPFAVATDTAGSGRVPAALNGIMGFKPSRGLISTVGLVPACRSLDCISLMAHSVDDLRRVFDVVAAVDEADPWSRPRRPARVPHPRIGLPPAGQLEFPDDEPMRAAHTVARRMVPGAGEVVDVPLAPFLDAGDLLYQGPWVAERLVEFDDFLREHPDSVLPVTAGVLAGGRAYTAIDTFRAQHRLQALRAQVDRLWARADVVVLPTVGTTYTMAEVLAEPLATNTTLGRYTHCANLLDLCAAVVPAGVTADGRPCSLMVLGPPLGDEVVLDVAQRLAELLAGPVDAGGPDDPGAGTTETVDIVVAGHHLSGQPRNAELTDRGGVLLELTTTSADYRLLRVGDHPAVPALLPAAGAGAAIEVEVWQLPAAGLAGLLAGTPPVLALGRLALADGRRVPGFVCEAGVATGDAGLPVVDITASGGWRRHLSQPAVLHAS